MDSNVPLPIPDKGDRGKWLCEMLRGAKARNTNWDGHELRFVRGRWV